MNQKEKNINEPQSVAIGDTALGGIAKFNDTCKTYKCVFNVLGFCKCREVNDKFCISYTAFK